MSDTLPDLHQADLDEVIVRQLFADVAAHTELLEVIPKHAPAARVPEIPSITLAEGLDGMLDGSFRSLQLRYRHDGATWWDTLMASAPGVFRLVRIRHDFPPA